MLMFQMTLEIAEEFYKRCKKQKADTEEEMIKILVDLAEEGRIKSVVETNRTPDQMVRDMAKNFGTVLHIKTKKRKEK